MKGKFIKKNLEDNIYIYISLSVNVFHYNNRIFGNPTLIWYTFKFSFSYMTLMTLKITAYLWTHLIIIVRKIYFYNSFRFSCQSIPDENILLILIYMIVSHHLQFKENRSFSEEIY